MERTLSVSSATRATNCDNGPPLKASRRIRHTPVGDSNAGQMSRVTLPSMSVTRVTFPPKT